MSKIGILIENKFEDSEYSEPANAFKKANHQIVHIGIKKETVKGEKKATEVQIDKEITEVTPHEFDAIFIPGGYSPDRLRSNDNVVNFIKEYAKLNKPLFFICHGAQLLITADILRGRKCTGWKSIIQDIKNAGGEFFDKEVVEDKNFVSSRSPSDLPAFIEKSLQKLKS